MAEDVRWKDTPEEKEARAALRVQPDDFFASPLEQEWHTPVFRLSNRIISSLIVRNEQGATLARPDIIDKLISKLAPFRDRRFVITGRFGGTYIVLEFKRSTNLVYTTHIDNSPWGARLAIQFRDPSDESDWTNFQEFVSFVKEAVADVALADARKKFMKDKIADRVGQSVGLNDPLAAKAELRPFLGGRRRKTKKHTKKHRTTRRRHLRIKH
jgi:hypothetical protein